MKQGWEIKKLREVCELITKGTTPTSIGFKFTDTGINFIKVESLTESGNIIPEKVAFISNECNQALRRSQLQEGDILFSIAGALGRIGIVGEEILPANTNQALAIIRLKQHANVSINFLSKYFISENTKEQIEKYRGGVAQQNLSLGQLNDLNIPIPPLSEQQHIVSILDEAFAAIDQAKENVQRNLQNAKDLFQSELNDIFTRNGVGWVENKLGEIGKVSMCKRIFKEQTAPSGDIPFYKIGTFGKEPNAFISFEVYNEFRKKFSFPKEGDILISASGTIGRCVRYDGKPAYFQDSNIVWIANDEKQVLNEYLHHFYSACKWLSTKGATIFRLYNDNLRQLEIAYPKDKKEQKKIVNQLDTLSTETKNLENTYQRKLNALEELKKSILQKAFSGELTKTQAEVSA